MSQEERTLVVERYGDMVWRLALVRTANVQDAEDIFQEVFLRYFSHDHEMKSEEHQRAWLIRCTINRTKSLLAAPWRHRTVPFSAAEKIGVTDSYQELYDTVLALPSKYKTVIHLYYYEELTIAEIASYLGVAEGTVKSQLSRGRALLRDMWKEELDL